jgi:hypothetical protein
MYQYTEELEVYGIQATDYKPESLAITGTGVGGAITDGDTHDYFTANKYTSKPSLDYSVPGHGKLIGVDLSAVLAKKSWADVNAMKTAVLSDNYISIINTHSSKAEYYLTSNNKLQIKLFFSTEANRNAWLDAVKNRPSDQFKELGTVVTTL